MREQGRKLRVFVPETKVISCGQSRETLDSNTAMHRVKCLLKGVLAVIGIYFVTEGYKPRCKCITKFKGFASLDSGATHRRACNDVKLTEDVNIATLVASDIHFNRRGVANEMNFATSRCGTGAQQRIEKARRLQ